MTKLHPKVKAQTGASGVVGAIIVIAAALGVTVTPAVAAAVIVLAGFAAGYLKSSGIIGS